MSHKKLMGLTVATAAALAFVSVPLSSAFAADTANVKCFGVNACKGQSACKTAKNTCKGHNACKGQGVSLMASEKSCMDAGGKTTEG